MTTLSAQPLGAALADAVTPRTSPILTRRRAWERRYGMRLRITDAAVVLLVTQLAAIPRLGPGDDGSAAQRHGIALVVAAAWIAALAMCGTRASRVTGSGTLEYRLVVRATLFAFGMAAILFALAGQTALHEQVAIALPLGLLSLTLGRRAWRRWLLARRQDGDYVSRALVVGLPLDITRVVASLGSEGASGYLVIGSAVLDERPGRPSTADEVAQTARGLGADAIIVASRPSTDPDFVKRLGWRLEGTAAELVLANGLTDVAGPRLSLHQVEGLPLMRVTIPTYDGAMQAVKRAFDVAVAALALVFIGVAFPFIALAIRLDSPGPVLFGQERIGQGGRPFRIWKFRTMRVGAESELARLVAVNEGAGPLFKLRSDPRVTRVGSFLRRTSLDELPQFWNVLVGDMSVVGPRPPLPSEVGAYEREVFRRLYVKPGITGPWQVSGRSDLTWEQSVRLDLHYVENWSIVSDLIIMWRTARVMVRPSGAY